MSAKPDKNKNTKNKKVEVKEVKKEDKSLKKQPQKEVKEVKHDIQREIVRIAGIDLNGNYSIEKGLRTIKGIGMRTAKVLTYQFCEKVKLPINTYIGNIPQDKDDILTKIVLDCKLPEWMYNRKNDLYTGETKQITNSDLIFTLREDKQRLSRIKSRRGMRLLAKLPVRGQRTKSNFRRKEGVVGVVKKKK